MTEETRNPNFHKDNIECTVEPDGEGKVKQTFKFKKNETWIKHEENDPKTYSRTVKDQPLPFDKDGYLNPYFQSKVVKTS